MISLYALKYNILNLYCCFIFFLHCPPTKNIGIEFDLFKVQHLFSPFQNIKYLKIINRHDRQFDNALGNKKKYFKETHTEVQPVYELNSASLFIVRFFCL